MFGRSIQKTALTLRIPDYTEHRGQRVLLVWRDVPHWMVVDEELKTFLYAFAHPVSLNQLFCNCSHFKSHRRALTRIVRQLHEKGILYDAAQGAAEVVKSVSTQPLPVENIAWNLTHRCNLHCRYCYDRNRPDAGGCEELSTGEVIRFLDTLTPFISSQATLTVLGGEPLMDVPKLLAVCRFARERKITPLISTNGTLIDEEFARAARQIDLEVQVSLDGPTAAMNDPLRGSGTFEKVRRGVAMLKAHRVHSILSLVCTRDNFDSLRDFLDMAMDWGVSEARFIPLKLMGGAQAETTSMVPHVEIITTACQLLKEKPAYRDLIGRDCLSILANTCRYSARRQSCGTGSQTLLLDAEGTLYPCLNLNQPAYAFGNIREPGFDFEKIWENHEILGNVRRCSSVLNIERACFDCPVKHWCLGGCRGETLVNTGNLAAQSIHCGDLRRTIFEIFWVLSENPAMIKSYEPMG